MFLCCLVQVVFILLLFVAAVVASQENRLQSKDSQRNSERGSKNVASHSCIHDQILEQRRRPGLKVYSVTPQVYDEHGSLKSIHRKGRALLAVSEDLKQQNIAKQPIRIYLNYDAVGHSPDRDCRKVGDIVKVGVSNNLIILGFVCGSGLGN